MSDLLAHSPRGDTPAQSYLRHLTGVEERAVENAQAAAEYCSGDGGCFVETVKAAAMYHDLGKLDEANQAVLEIESKKKLPVRHEDGGTKALLLLQRRESAVIVAAHHSGLFSQENERQKGNKPFRILEVSEHVDSHLDEYVGKHIACGFPVMPAAQAVPPLDKCGLTRRLALSCLVDADYFDTARHYGQETEIKQIPTRWAERILALDQYVSSLDRGINKADRERSATRQAFYNECRNAPVSPSGILACDAPVGTGKTTAVMAYLLRVAQDQKLRRVFVVLPYTNIIRQSVDVYRKALVLPDENPDEVVAEHHHQADFKDIALRGMATLWRSPIIVTTAVQFFETLASDHPARLRKLHQLPGSAVFVDESHAAVPVHMWPQIWEWFGIFAKKWRGTVILASGSLCRFWELQGFVSAAAVKQPVHNVVPTELAVEMRLKESRRIVPKREVKPFTGESLLGWIAAKAGPRLVIMNTVQSAAVLADSMKKKGLDVLHLSTALTPIHRDVIISRVKERLRYSHSDWTLVATSCVEAGVNFSFRTGFRESCSLTSLIQTGGRVNRGAEYETSEVWDFRVCDPPLYNDNPSVALSRKVLDGLFDESVFDQCDLETILAKAIIREMTDHKNARAREILTKEHEMEYPDVARLCRVIDSDTRTVLVDRDIAAKLRKGFRMASNELQRHCVQLWASKIESLKLRPLFNSSEDEYGLYVWEYDYDPDFLGYMQGVLPILKMNKTGLAIM
jgi:CRISPR-associated endonuclease/helicase Cas3